MTKTFEDGVRAGVELVLTHTEHYENHESADAFCVQPGKGYWMTIKPDRTKEGELTLGSAEHRAKRIEAWKSFALRVLKLWPSPGPARAS